jgi:hypothetical protein
MREMPLRVWKQGGISLKWERLERLRENKYVGERYSMSSSLQEQPASISCLTPAVPDKPSYIILPNTVRAMTEVRDFMAIFARAGKSRKEI